jgi:hypothetical protein
MQVKLTEAIPASNRTFRTGEPSMNELKVLGIDLACINWADNGSATLSFVPGESGHWTRCELGVIDWPKEPLNCDSTRMAAVIDQFARDNGIGAVSLDGPQGWREPNAASRKGVGRWCEFVTRTQGKTGEYGTTYPRNQRPWIQFCIQVFEHLMRGSHVTLVNDPLATRLDPLPRGSYFLLECFPTSTWVESGLPTLPGKQTARRTPGLVGQFRDAMRACYGMPTCTQRVLDDHDDLQAMVSALPAAGLLAGPCMPIPKGNPARRMTTAASEHWVEGIIWDARPLAHVQRPDVTLIMQVAQQAPGLSSAGLDNPYMPDERDPVGEGALGRGRSLFEKLVDLANAGHSYGVGYAQFLCCVPGTATFRELAGRQYQNQKDTPHALRLAQEITRAAGGRRPVTKNGLTIMAGMDTFIWSAGGVHDRPAGAFRGTMQPPYSREEWRAIFPDGTRKLLENCECGIIHK